MCYPFQTAMERKTVLSDLRKSPVKFPDHSALKKGVTLPQNSYGPNETQTKLIG